EKGDELPHALVQPGRLVAAEVNGKPAIIPVSHHTAARLGRIIRIVTGAVEHIGDRTNRSVRQKRKPTAKVDGKNGQLSHRPTPRTHQPDQASDRVRPTPARPGPRQD